MPIMLATYSTNKIIILKRYFSERKLAGTHIGEGRRPDEENVWRGMGEFFRWAMFGWNVRGIVGESVRAEISGSSFGISSLYV